MIGQRRSSFHDVSKRLVAPSLASDETTAHLLAAADVVIVTSEVDPLEHDNEPSHPEQIVVCVSPFASTGPYAGWRSTDLVDAAIGGHLRLSGDPAREPLQGVPDLVHHAAGVMAFISAMAALIARQRGAGGQRVELSHHETIAALHQFTLLRYTHNGAVLNRMGNRYAGPGAPIGGYECADGFVGLVLPQEDQMERMLAVTGLVSMLDEGCGSADIPVPLAESPLGAELSLRADHARRSVQALSWRNFGRRYRCTDQEHNGYERDKRQHGPHLLKHLVNVL